MSIPGLTDRQKSFKEIGRLRKGAAKEPDNPRWHPSDLKYFRPDFRPDEQEAAARFVDAYGTTPTRINIRLAFGEVSRVWDAHFTCYNSAGMLGMAGGVEGREGLWWIYLRSNQTGEIIVKDALPAKEFDPKVPVYSYKNRKGEDVPVYAKPEGKLRVLIPELQMVNYVTVLTHSWYDIARISEQLAAIDELSRRVGLSLPLVPLALTRRPETISVAYNGKKSLAEKWLINIDVRSDWAANQFAMLDSIQPGTALPAPRTIELPALPAGVNDVEWENEYEEEPEPEPEPEPTQTEPSAPPAIEKYAAIKTPKGANLGDLSDEQLNIVLLKGDALQSGAAKYLLEPVDVDDFRIWDALCVKADDLGIETPMISTNARRIVMWRTMKELKTLIETRIENNDEAARQAANE